MKLERSILITLAAHESVLQRIKSLTAEIGLHLGRCENRFDLLGPKPVNEFPELGDLPWPNGSEEHFQILYDEKNRRKTHRPSRPLSQSDDQLPESEAPLHTARLLLHALRLHLLHARQRAGRQHHFLNTPPAHGGPSG